jgi:hypothetical protein
LSLHFSEVSTIFYAFYKIQLKGFTIEDYILQTGPWKFLAIRNHILEAHKTSWEDLEVCNWVPGPRGGAAGRNPARPAALSVGE